jgi:hypothetical protein
VANRLRPLGEDLEARRLLTIQTWISSGSNQNWATSANWNNGPIAPGDTLLFNGSDSSSTSNNNESAGNNYFLQFGQGGYNLTGNGIDLADSGTQAILANNAGGNNTLNLPVTITGNATANVTTAGSTLTLTNSLSTSGGGPTLTDQGAGTLVVSSSVNTDFFHGILDVQGVLRFDSPLLDATAELDGGLLTGTGGIEQIIGTSNGGVLSPGDATPGTLTAGDVLLDPSDTFAVALDGPGAGQYGQLSASGPVDLAGATLSVTLNYAPAGTDSYVIIQNTSNAAVQGTFHNLPQGGTITVDGTQFVINYDGGPSGNEVILSVSPPPVANPDFYTLPENDQNFSVPTPGILGNDTPSSGLHPLLVTSPVHGTLTLNDDGSFSYVPATGFSGTDTFTYEATNGLNTSAAATVTLVVNPVNQPPQVSAVSYTAVENNTLSVAAASGVLATAVSPQGLALTAHVVSGPAHESSTTAFTLNTNGSFSYTPAQGFTGTDSFTFIARDSNGLTSTPATVTISVQDVPSTVISSSDSVTENTPKTVATPGVLAGATNVVGNTLSAVLVNNAADGVVALNPDGSFTYTPATNFSGTDSFTFKANDGTLDSNTATVTLTVAPNPVAPTAGDASFSMLESTTGTPTQLAVAAPGLLLNDQNPSGGTLSLIVLAQPLHGSFTVAPQNDGAFTYTPATNFSGTDSFSYYLQANGLNSNVATVTINVTQVPVAPIAGGDAYNVRENTTLSVGAPGVLANDVDPNGGQLSAVLVSNPNDGSLTLNSDGSFTYTPFANFSGSDSFTYEANNGHLSSTAATVALTINPVPIAPTAANHNYSVLENQALAVAAPGLLLGSTNPNAGALTVVVVGSPLHGSFTAGPSNDGSFTYTPATNFSGTDSFSYYLQAGGLISNVATVTINVAQVPVAPVATDDAYNVQENGTLSVGAPGVLANDVAPNGGLLTAVLVSNPTDGSLTLNSDGSFTYIPFANFSGSDSFTYKASNGPLSSAPATVTLTISQVPIAPTAANHTYSVLENQAIAVAAPGLLLGSTNPNAGALTVVVVGPPLHGSFTAGPSNDGSFTYTPAPNFSGTDSFSYYLQAGGLISNVATATITVVPVAVPPIVHGSAYTTEENATLNLSAPGVLGNDIDPNGNPLSAILQTGASHGTLQLNSNGSFIYTPTANYSGPDSFTYVAYNGTLESTPVTVSLTVLPVLLPPTTASLGFAMQEDDQLVVPSPGILGTATDPQGLALHAVLVNPTLNGSLALNPDGSFTYTPRAGFIGTDSFTFRANDGQLDSNLSTVTIAVGAIPVTTVQLAAGVPDHGGFTDISAPTFTGTTLPGLTVLLYGQTAGGSPAVVGQTQADASGHYTVTTTALPDGSYHFTADAVRPNGLSTGSIDAGSLTIDTTSPKITDVFIVPRTGQIMITFQPGVSGMNLASLVDPANYSFSRRSTPDPRSFVITSVTLVPPASPTGPVMVALTSSVGKPIPAGHYLFEILAGGITDNAGNRLDGLFNGGFPTGGGGPGSPFDALFISRSQRPSNPVATRHFIPVLTHHGHSRALRSDALRRESDAPRPAGPLGHGPARRNHVPAARRDRHPSS